MKPNEIKKNRGFLEKLRIEVCDRKGQYVDTRNYIVEKTGRPIAQIETIKSTGISEVCFGTQWYMHHYSKFSDFNDAVESIEGQIKDFIFHTLGIEVEFFREDNK